MLIGCITGPDFATAKMQIEKGAGFCDGVELRVDLLECDPANLMPLIEGVSIVTGMGAEGLKLRPHYLTIGWDDPPLFSEHTQIIRSYHNFEETPTDLDDLLLDVLPANIYKIATYAKSTLDALRMLAFVQRHKNVAGMCMGPLGQITRILAPLVGSFFTFAALGREGAAGQLQVEELLQVYNFHLHGKETKAYGLIGNPISQSPGHLVHNTFFREGRMNSVYVKMIVEPEELAPFLEEIRKLSFFQGLSVTIPHKEQVARLVDSLEGDALSTEVVNTLAIEGGEICGSNTDGVGALDAIEKVRPVLGLRCVILGAGGTAKAIAYEAAKRGAEVTLLSRKGEQNDQFPYRYGCLETLGGYDILINATPEPFPVGGEKLLEEGLFMDVSLEDRENSLLKEAEKKGHLIIPGIEMFHLQASRQRLRWGQIPSL